MGAKALRKQPLFPKVLYTQSGQLLQYVLQEQGSIFPEGALFIMTSGFHLPPAFV